MLYIVYDRDFQTGKEKEAEWHVGEPVPEIRPHRVISIQADGEEAAHIEEIMGGGINQEPATYYGDIARTIFLNL